MEAWIEVFEKRLQTFLRVLVEREEAAIKHGRLKDDQRLSSSMQQSWENGDSGLFMQQGRILRLTLCSGRSLIRGPLGHARFQRRIDGKRGLTYLMKRRGRWRSL